MWQSYRNGVLADECLYATLMGVAGAAGQLELAFNLLDEMVLDGIQPSKVCTHPPLSSMCVRQPASSEHPHHSQGVHVHNSTNTGINACTDVLRYHILEVKPFLRICSLTPKFSTLDTIRRYVFELSIVGGYNSSH